MDMKNRYAGTQTEGNLWEVFAGEEAVTYPYCQRYIKQKLKSEKKKGTI